MRLKGIVLRNDDTIPDDVDLNALVLPETVHCVADFDSSKRIGEARVWRDDDGNIMAEVDVAAEAEDLIMSDYSGLSIGERVKIEPPEVSRYQFLTCSVILPLKDRKPSQALPSLLDVAVVAKPANSPDDPPPMVIL